MSAASPTRVILGLGSSAPDALGFLRKAVRHLKGFDGLTLLSISPIYRSDAMTPEGAPEAWKVPYLNLAAACLVRDRSPVDFLTQLKALEKLLGRRTRERWAPREIDIDILAWGEEQIEVSGVGSGAGSDGESPGADAGSSPLTVPHPGLASRPFALLPLLDVVPEWRHPDPSRREEFGRIADAWRIGCGIPYHTERTALSLTEIVGIVNVTPDSFSNDGIAVTSTSETGSPISDRLLPLALELIRGGATVLDIGAESTRPTSTALGAGAELQRLEQVLPALEALRAEHPTVRFSLDSRHAETVKNIGRRFRFDFINDVEGFQYPAMAEAALALGSEIVAMHSLGIPPSQDRVLDQSRDPVQLILEWADEKAMALRKQGFRHGQIHLDPGIGFGKTPEQNLRLIRQAARLHATSCALWFGHSRKSFMARFTKAPAAERDPETAACSAWLETQGIEYLRVHHPVSTSRAIAAGKFSGDGVSRYV